MTHVAVTLSLLALAIPLSSCGGNGNAAVTINGTPQAQRAVARAAAKMKRSAYRFGLTTTMTAGGESLPIRADGAVDEKRDRTHTTVNTPDAGGAIETIANGTTRYVKSPTLGGGGKWVVLDLKKIAGRSGVTTGSLDQSTTDPSEYLTFLRAAGRAERDGTETIRGVQTVRYLGQIDTAKAIKGAPKATRTTLDEFVKKTGVDSMTYTVWIDDHDLVRKLAFEMSAQDKRVIEASMVLFDIGGPITIAVPAPQDTVDLDQANG